MCLTCLLNSIRMELKRGRIVADMVQAVNQFVAGAFALENECGPFAPFPCGNFVLPHDGFQVSGGQC